MVRFFHPLRFLICGLLGLWMLGGERSAHGAGFEEMHRFTRFGAKPQGVVRGPDGNFYGVTKTGGLRGLGTLYRIAAETGKVETLANFGDFVIEPSEQIVVDQGGNVLGLAQTTIWRWNKTVGLSAVGTLRELGIGATEGGLVLDSAGGLIGTAQFGGANGGGILWRWHPSLGARRLGDFEEAKTGLRTKSPLALDRQDFVYGCSERVGNEMILWRWKPVTGFEKLASLPEAQVGTASLGVKVDAAFQVWGITVFGGANHDGTLWRWSQSGGLEKLGDFGPAVSGQEPSGPLTLGSDGYPMGISTMAIWKWTPSTGLMRLSDASFDQVGGTFGAIAEGNDGTIYGAANIGPECVWKWSPATGGVILQRFQPYPDQSTEDGIVRDAQGRFYGTALVAVQSSTVLWRWSESQGYETLGNFDLNLGFPKSPLAIDAAGNVFGIAQATDHGTLWRWSEAGGLIKLVDFDPATFDRPTPVIVLGDEGQVYGTSGNDQNGWIWKWTASNGLSKAATFDQPGVSFAPNQIRGADGEWYGIQERGGSASSGFLWSWSETAGVVIRHHFTLGENIYPGCALTRDTAGNIYGVTINQSKLWKWNSASGFTFLANFDDGLTGTDPIALRVNASGMVQGICARGGVYEAGTLWAWSEPGGLCAIHHFRRENTGGLQALGLTEDSGDNLCGLANGLLWRYIDGTQPSAPAVATGPILQSDAAGVIISNTVNPNGAPTEVYISYGSHPDGITAKVAPAPSVISGSVPQSFITTLTGLPQRSMLFARAWASNSHGLSMGNLLVFIAPNQPPGAVDDFIHSPPIANGSFIVNVLANDHDGNDAMHLVSVTQGQNGVATIENNMVRYTPNEDYAGNAVFAYTVRDDFGGESMGRLNIHNFPVTATDDVDTVYDGHAVVFPLSNDFDQDGDSLQIVAVSQPYVGTVTFTANSISYDVAPDFYGTDYFTYTVTDDRGSTATANVEVSPGVKGIRRLLGVGDVISTPAGDLKVKRIGATGVLRAGYLLVKSELGGKRGQALIDRPGHINAITVFRTGDSLTEIPGSIIESIEEPAGNSVSVKYAIEGEHSKLRRAVFFLERGTAPRMAMHEGEILPDGAVLTAITRFSELGDRLFVLGKLRLADGKTAQTLRVWQDGQVEELARTGTTQVDGQPIRSITTLTPSPTSPSDNRWLDDDGGIATRLILQNGGQAVTIFRAGTDPVTPAQAGSTSPREGKYLRFGLPTACPGGAAFCSLETTSTFGRQRSLYGMMPERGLRWIASQYFSLSESSKTKFTRFTDPIASDAGEFAFLANITHGTQSSRALFWCVDGKPKLIVREGTPWPDSIRERIYRIKSFIYPRLSSRGPVFTATIAEGLSLWATDRLGAPILILKPGMRFEVRGKVRTVASIRALEGANSPGQEARGSNPFGQLEAVLKFTDGTESLFQCILP